MVRETVKDVHEALAAFKGNRVALEWKKFQLQLRSVEWYAESTFLILDSCLI